LSTPQTFPLELPVLYSLRFTREWKPATTEYVSTRFLTFKTTESCIFAGELLTVILTLRGEHGEQIAMSVVCHAQILEVEPRGEWTAVSAVIRHFRLMPGCDSERFQSIRRSPCDLPAPVTTI